MKRIILTKFWLVGTILMTGFIFSCAEKDIFNPINFETQIEADSIVFAVIGDFGKAGNPEEKVADMVKSWNPDFIITTGDNNYESGEMKTLKKNISDYYGDYIFNFDAPGAYQCYGKAFEESINRFFPVPGNHDANNSKKLAPYLDYFTLPQHETYYTFEWGPVRFYALNSVTGNLDEQEKWLMEQLEQSVSPYNIVYFHHSPYSPGPHGNSIKMQWAYYQHNVDIVLTGHDHIYARIKKMTEENMYYIVNGLGGKSLYNCDERSLPMAEFQSYCYDEDFGAIKTTASKNKLQMELYVISQPDVAIDRVIIE